MSDKLSKYLVSYSFLGTAGETGFGDAECQIVNKGKITSANLAWLRAELTQLNNLKSLVILNILELGDD